MIPTTGPDKNHPAYRLWRENADPKAWADAFVANGGNIVDWFAWAMDTAYEEGVADGR